MGGAVGATPSGLLGSVTWGYSLGLLAKSHRILSYVLPLGPPGAGQFPGPLGAVAWGMALAAGWGHGHVGAHTFMHAQVEGGVLAGVRALVTVSQGPILPAPGFPSGVAALLLGRLWAPDPAHGALPAQDGLHLSQGALWIGVQPQDGDWLCPSQVPPGLCSALGFAMGGCFQALRIIDGWVGRGVTAMLCMCAH